MFQERLRDIVSVGVSVNFIKLVAGFIGVITGFECPGMWRVMSCRL